MHSSIPSVDFSRFNGSGHDRRQIASEIDNALSTIGFFYLINHGIEQHKIDACFEWVSRILSPVIVTRPTRRFRVGVSSTFRSRRKKNFIHRLDILTMAILGWAKRKYAGRHV